MTDTRTAAEYRSASDRLWQLAAGATLAASHDAAENDAALVPKDDWAR
jgi:hypothetical protein